MQTYSSTQKCACRILLKGQGIVKNTPKSPKISGIENSPVSNCPWFCRTAKNEAGRRAGFSTDFNTVKSDFDYVWQTLPPKGPDCVDVQQQLTHCNREYLIWQLHLKNRL